MVCTECMGNKDKIREAILNIDIMADNLKLLSGRVEQLENKYVTNPDPFCDVKTVSELVRSNSDKIKKLTEKQDQTDRKFSIIIKGLDASMGEGLSYVVKEIFCYLGYTLGNWQAHRINHTNLVRVIFTSIPERLYVLKHSNKLRYEQSYANIFVNPDYSYDQRQANKKLRANLKDIQIRIPKAFIRNGCISYLDKHGKVVPCEEHTQVNPIPSIPNPINDRNTPMSSQHIVERRRRGNSAYSS